MVDEASGGGLDGEFARLDRVVAWMRANGVRRLANEDGTCLELGDAPLPPAGEPTAATPRPDTLKRYAYGAAGGFKVPDGPGAVKA